MDKKRSLWDRITGGIRLDEDYEEIKKVSVGGSNGSKKDRRGNNWIEEENEEAELAVDVYQTGTDIIVQTFVAGVKPEDIELSIARDMITIAGHREESRTIDENNYFLEFANIMKVESPVI